MQKHHKEYSCLETPGERREEREEGGEEGGGGGGVERGRKGGGAIFSKWILEQELGNNELMMKQGKVFLLDCLLGFYFFKQLKRKRFPPSTR